MKPGRKTMKGRFIPKNAQKYVGNVNQIFFRSSWERRMCMWLDQNNSILLWSSETLAIPYINPVSTDAYGRQKISRYYPDFLVKYIDKTGTVRTEIIEIKPLRETKIMPGMKQSEKMVVAVNLAKWEAARQFAQANGAVFRLASEKDLFKGAKK